MRKGMIEAPVRTTNPASVEENLRAEMAQGDAVAKATQPILPFLLAQSDSSLVGDEILARVRGMISQLAAQLLDALVGRFPETDGQTRDCARLQTVSQALLEAPVLLGHLHALALEWQLIEQLQRSLAIDPVMPPLMRSAVALPEGAMRDLAMELLTAQARWHQSQRRMQLSLSELSPEQLEGALRALSSSVTADGRLAAAEARVRSRYDEQASRVALGKRLLASMGSSAGTALDVSHAGASLFVTALALRSGQPRDVICLSTHGTQLARLALTLRAAGLGEDVIERQILTLHPEAMLPDGLERLSPDRAAAILSGASDGAL